MRGFFKVFLIIIVFFIFNSKSYSHDNVAYINLDYVLNNSIFGKKIIDKLNQINNENIKVIQSNEKILKDKETKHLKEKNILSKEIYNQNLKKLKNEIKEFRLTNIENKKKFQQTKKNEFDNFLSKIEPILNNYMKENSLNILLDKKNIFIGKSELDITEKIINIINLKIK